MAILAISVAPSGVPELSLSQYVAKAIEALRADGRVRYEVGSMFTTIEGEFPVLMELATKMHEALFDAGVQRVGTVIKIDDRRDREVHMEEKVSSVLEKADRIRETNR